MAINLAIDGNEVKIQTDRNGHEKRWHEVDPRRSLPFVATTLTRRRGRLTKTGVTNFTAEQVKEEMDNQISNGFCWMPELVTTLRYYSKHEEDYLTLSDYYPEIAKCLDEFLKKEAERIGKSLQ